MSPGWDLEVDVAVAAGGACGGMTALRAARDQALVVAVFERSTREGCNAAISSGSLAALDSPSSSQHTGASTCVHDAALVSTSRVAARLPSPCAW